MSIGTQHLFSSEIIAVAVGGVIRLHLIEALNVNGNRVTFYLLST